MSHIFFGQKATTVIFAAFTLFAVALVSSPQALAEEHNITLSAEELPNGQFAYKRERQAVIPRPTLFVKQGDIVPLSIPNNPSKPRRFKVPSPSHARAA